MNALRNQNGKSLILIVFILSLCSVISLLGTQDLSSQAIKINSTSRLVYKSSSTLIKNNIMSILKNPFLLSQAISANATMSCLQSHTDCQLQPQPVNVLKIDTQDIVNTSQPNLGFTLSGKVCQEFDQPSNQTCIYQAITTWRPDCTTSPCIDPKLIIKVQFAVKPSFKSNNSIDADKLVYEETL